MFGRKKADDIEDVGPQHARHLPTGAEVESESRDRIAYRLDGRTWSPFVERGTSYAVYLTARPMWSDGTPMSDADLAQGEAVLSEVLRHWGVDTVEIVRPAAPTDEGGSRT